MTLLTTKDKIKAKIGIDNTNFDAVIDAYIRSISAYVERKTNRILAQTSYQEVIDAKTRFEGLLQLGNFPITALTALEYRSGTPTAPVWVSYNTNDYELYKGGSSGLLRIHFIVSAGTVLRASYTAGYKIDWVNETDVTKHTLPADLTELADKMVIRAFKKRDAEGKSSEGFDGSTVSWTDELSQFEKDTLAQYTFHQFA